MKQMIVRCIEMVEQHQQWKKVRTNITQGVEQEKVVAVATAITRRPAIGIVVGHRLCQGHIAGGTISMMMVRNHDGEQHQKARHQKHITNNPISYFPMHDANVRKNAILFSNSDKKSGYFRRFFICGRKWTTNLKKPIFAQNSKINFKAIIMENTTNLASPTARIEVVDALRGFAVLAILLVHNVEHFIYPVYPTSSPGWLEVMDLGVFHATFALFAGKSYSIFALLFGFTFFIQNENQRRRGKDFGYRFLWRMLLLMAFGTLNAAFYPAGDVLLLYALVGIILFLFRKASDRVLLVGALFFLLQPIEWYHFIASRIDVTHQLPDFGVAEMYAQTAAYTSEGDLWNFIWQNITLGQKASLLWAVNAGRYMQTAGLFLLGFYIGRKQLFLSTPSNQRLWIKILIIAAVVFSPLYALKEQVMLCDEEIIRQSAGTALDMWQKLAFTFVLVASFVTLYQWDGFRKRIGALRVYGKMSLSNYVSQSFLGALLYFPVGLNLAPIAGYSASLLLGLVMFFIQIRFCGWWLKRHKHGPLEGIWHRLTWLNASPK